MGSKWSRMTNPVDSRNGFTIQNGLNASSSSYSCATPRKPRQQGTNALLPFELIQRVALFVEDSTTFFDFLQALQPAPSLLGHLQILHELSKVLPKEDLWPSLRLTVDSTPKLMPYLKVIAGFYDVIVVTDAVDIPGFETLLALSTAWLHIRTHSARAMGWYYAHDRVKKWTTFMTTREIPIALRVLPTLASLESLELLHMRGISSAAADMLFDYIPRSKLTTLKIEHPIKITHRILVNTILWLRLRPVSEFRFGKWTFNQVLDFVASFYEALMSCASLKVLGVTDCTLPQFGNDSTLPQTFPMHQLELHNCDVTWHVMRTFLARSVHLRSCSISTQTHYDVKDFDPPQWPHLKHLRLRGLSADLMQRICLGIKAPTLLSVTVNGNTMVSNPNDRISHPPDVPFLGLPTSPYATQCSIIFDVTQAHAIDQRPMSSLIKSLESTLGNALIFPPRIEHLTYSRIEKYSFSATGGSGAFTLLLASPHLHTLAFRNCGMMDTGAKALAGILRRCHTNLQVLCLEQNGITHKGATAVIQAVQVRSNSMQTLTIQDTSITDKYLLRLEKVIKKQGPKSRCTVKVSNNCSG
ncbi:Aste57867_19726 [Aphanomyces stellatus]|uniref:Aste57867_19726 protein n=1 Tax=Aphanomyces stellatus TaxID=120398 RepID=A0A485LD30_9STRA|nr:hypothetical protein As57867_019661 [Aphanomyces stellatus]VFT96424.1 Aste57867_19726 [Aphanomyces stellatus]